MAWEAGRGVERLESRVLYAIVDAELHRPPTVLFGVGNLNGDGVPDLVSLHKEKVIHRDIAARAAGKEDVYVWKIKTHMGLGDGTWGGGDEEDIAVTNPMAVCIADLNGDGKSDIVVTENPTTKGQLAKLVIVPGSGKDELVTKPGGGLETSTIALSKTTDVRATVVADLNGDGRAELCVFGFEPQPIAASGKAMMKPQPNLGVFDGASPDGRFPAGPRQTVSLDGIMDYSQIAFDDLTGDGAADFVITDDSNRMALVWSPRSNFMRCEKNPLYVESGQAGTNPIYERDNKRLIGTGDLDGDGRVDIVAAIGDRIAVGNVMEGGKIGQVRTTEGIGGLPPVLAREGTIRVGDVDGDGRPDLIAVGDDGTIYVARNTTFGPSKTAQMPTFNRGYKTAKLATPGLVPESIEVADFNRDGRADILAKLELPKGNNQEGDLTTDLRTTFTVLLGNTTADGNAYFERGDKPTQSQFRLGDLNRDKKADLVSVTPTHVVTFDAAGVKEDVYVWKVKTRMGNGDGTFSKSVATITLDGIERPAAIAIGDLDGDGLMDVVVVSKVKQPATTPPQRAQHAMATLRGDGRGGLKPATGPTVGGTGLRVTGVVIADVNRDGRADVAVVGSESNLLKTENQKRVRVDSTLSAARGSERTVTTYLPELEAGDYSITAGPDLDGDGAPDLVVTKEKGTAKDQLQQNPRNRAILSPTGGGAELFDVTVLEGTTLAAGSVVKAGDLDGDGRPDLVAATADNQILVMRCDPKLPAYGEAVAAKSVNTPVGLASMFLLTGDIDGDGDADLMAIDRLLKGGNVGINEPVPDTNVHTFVWNSRQDLPET